MTLMVESRGFSTSIVGVTILVGMFLSIVPLPTVIPAELGYLRPEWVAMILVYWVIALTQSIGVFTAWVVGLLMDILLGSLLGQHALSFVIVAYIAANLYQRLRMFSVWQQAIIVFAILGLNQMMNFWIESFAGLTEWQMWYLLPALSGALLWPWVFLTLRNLRRRFGVK